MKCCSILFIAAVALVPGAASAQSGADGSGAPTLVVQGQGAVSRPPDVASLSVSIETNDASATRAQAKNNAAFAALLAALERVQVPNSAVQSSGYDLRYVPPPEPTPAAATASGAVRRTMPVARNPQPGERYGYVVTRSVTIVDLDPSRVGAAVDASAGAGATNIGGVTFSLRDQRGAYNSALAAAFDDADAQARALAAAAHLRILRVQRVEAGPSSLPGPVAFARMAAEPLPTQIAPSNVEVRANVTVTYTIAPGG